MGQCIGFGDLLSTPVHYWQLVAIGTVREPIGTRAKGYKARGLFIPFTFGSRSYCTGCCGCWHARRARFADDAWHADLFRVAQRVLASLWATGLLNRPGTLLCNGLLAEVGTLLSFGLLWFTGTLLLIGLLISCWHALDLELLVDPARCILLDCITRAGTLLGTGLLRVHGTLLVVGLLIRSGTLIGFWFASQ
jgi:hypothetical protein